jgi:hypothetical protein
VRDLAEFMQAASQAFKDRDIEKLLQLTHPDAEMELFANGGRLVRGREGARKIMAAAWSSPVYGLALHHFEQLGDDTVLGVGSVRYEGDTGFRSARRCGYGTSKTA